ncbi:MAG: hypothetical protein ABL964_09500 [Steroidobacteraceae bacterium]
MAAQVTQVFDDSEHAEQAGASVSFDGPHRVLPVERLRYDVADLTLALQQLLDLGPGENPEALLRLERLIAKLKKAMPESHFRDDKLRDLATDFALWFSRAPRLKFDYNDEALRSMLQVDIHRLSAAG